MRTFILQLDDHRAARIEQMTAEHNRAGGQRKSPDEIAALLLDAVIDDDEAIESDSVRH